MRITKLCSLLFLVSLLWNHLLFAQIKTNAGTEAKNDRKAILTVLEKQVYFWNAGDLAKFMQGYWQSDSLAFIGSSGLTYGWQNTLDNYQKHYPDQASRGTLRFDILRVELLGKDASGQETAFVVGKFSLARPEKGDAKGHFTLLWRKIKGQWKIVIDHSS